MTPPAPRVTAPNLPPGFDFTDPEIYAQRLPTEELAEVRRAAPIWWNEQPPDVGGFGDGGFWVARELPLLAIAELLGVPLEDRDKLFDWTNQMIAGDDDPEFADYNPLQSTAELIWYAMQLAARKKETPGEDIVSTLIDSEADGQLTEAEFGMFVVTLTVAGNETTRNSITQGMMAFTDYPDQ